MRFLHALLALFLLAAPAHAKFVDTLIWGGPITTGDEAHPRVEALAIANGQITYAGARRIAARLRGPNTRVIDLEGASAFPGFTDAHAHLRGIGERELTFNLEGTPSLAALVAAVKTRVDAAPANGAVIVGRGWIETHWPEKRFPTRADLDAVSPDNAVILVRADGHALIANARALAMANVTDATPAPSGGQILKEAAGHPTGMLIDNAMGLMQAVGAKAAHPSLDDAIDAALRVYPARGWVGAHNMSVGWDEAGAWRARSDTGPIALRVYNAVTPEAGAELLRLGAQTSRDGRVVTRAIKYYADGALGSRGAALFAPYADAPNSTGLILLRHDEALAVFAQALRQGIQIATHAIGDRGNATALDIYAEAFAAVPAAQRKIQQPRWRIEHAQIVRPADIPRFAQLGVIASMQPSHAIGDLYFAPARLGFDRLVGAYAWKSMADAHVIVAAGSDAPVEKGDPLIEFYAAIARRSLDGFSGEGWHREQAMDRATALKMFTAWPAYAAFAETERGALKPGMAADVSVFSVDLMTAPAADIARAHAVMTMIDGVVAWRAEGQ